jgi:hypothetical protein
MGLLDGKVVIVTGGAHGFFWQAPEETNGVILDWVKAQS